jgi:hypothetical protein
MTKDCRFRAPQIRNLDSAGETGGLVAPKSWRSGVSAERRKL